MAGYERWESAGQLAGGYKDTTGRVVTSAGQAEKKLTVFALETKHAIYTLRETRLEPTMRIRLCTHPGYDTRLW